MLYFHRSRSNGCSGYAPLKGENEQQVEADVENRGQQQEPKGCFAVAQGADNAREQVIEKGGRNADECGQQVGIGSVVNNVGRAHGV